MDEPAFYYSYSEDDEPSKPLDDDWVAAAMRQTCLGEVVAWLVALAGVVVAWLAFYQIEGL